MADSVRTRFAPSPTGFLHIGGVRTALYNYLLAKKTGGQFILRLEDTDQARFVAEGVEQIVTSLDWAGLKPDEGFWISEGRHQSTDYIQSTRHQNGIYQRFADNLLEEGLAYYSPTTAEKLSELRDEAKRAKQPFIYRRQPAEKGQTLSLENTPIRLDVEAVKQQLGDSTVKWSDEIRGEFTDNLDLIEDFIIIKSDGYPTYNFANVIDDYDMQISHVIRGDEFISSTGKHALLYDLFGWERPVFVHLPVINGQDGKKLSKRTGDTNLLDYRDKGYLPAAVLNFLALLGWNDGTEQEIYSLEELVSKFDLTGINRSPAVFDQKRLDWVNGLYIRQMPLDDLVELAKDFWPKAAHKADEGFKKRVLDLVQERLKYLAEIPDLTEFFFKDLPVNPNLIKQHKQLGKMTKSELKQLLEQSRDLLKDSDFTVTDLHNKLNQLLESTGQKPVVLFSLIRIATTQAPASPGLAETMSVLGKDKTLQRIDEQIQHL